MYNPNNPSNWSWSKAFDEMAKTIHKAEMTQQVINHLGGYTGKTKWLDLNYSQQKEMYNILNQIL